MLTLQIIQLQVMPNFYYVHYMPGVSNSYWLGGRMRLYKGLAGLSLEGIRLRGPQLNEQASKSYDSDKIWPLFFINLTLETEKALNYLKYVWTLLKKSYSIIFREERGPHVWDPCYMLCASKISVNLVAQKLFITLLMKLTPDNNNFIFFSEESKTIGFKIEYHDLKLGCMSIK